MSGQPPQPTAEFAQHVASRSPPLSLTAKPTGMLGTTNQAGCELAQRARQLLAQLSLTADPTGMP